MGNYYIHFKTSRVLMDIDSQQRTWNLSGVLLTTTTTRIYIGISPQHMEFKATHIAKLDAI